MHDDQDTKSRLVELTRTDRLVSNKSEGELLNDLKVYLARLRDDPRSIPDRLRVAAIQLRLGRIAEAMIHYEGVLREYVQTDQIMNAIALCLRILKSHPEISRIQRFLAALYARAPRGTTDAPSAVTPILLEDQLTKVFVVEDSNDIVIDELEEEGTENRDMVVDRIFPEINTDRHLLQTSRGGDDSHLLTYEKNLDPEIGDGEPVILLTKRKKKP